MGQMQSELRLQGWCALALAPGWSFDQQDAVTTIHRQDDATGALHVTLYRRTHAEVLAQLELIDLTVKFVQSLGSSMSRDAIHMVSLDQHPASYIQMTDGQGQLWRVWHVADPARVAMLSYCGRPEDAPDDEAAVDQMVQSFRWEPLPEPPEDASAENDSEQPESEDQPSAGS